jgi:RNA polymerase sigma-70 factor (ECF subfamily)
VVGVKNGDPDAVGEVYVRLADRLLGYLTARVRDRAAAEDLLEATFIELLQKGHTIRGDSASIKVWLFRAAHYNALDYLRKIKRRGEWLEADLTPFDQPEGTRGPADRAEADDTAGRVRAAMSTLSGEQRQVLLLRYVAGLTAAEVAEVMAKSDGAVRALQHRGERSLARALPGYGVPSAASEPASSLTGGASPVQDPTP